MRGKDASSTTAISLFNRFRHSFQQLLNLFPMLPVLLHLRVLQPANASNKKQPNKNANKKIGSSVMKRLIQKDDACVAASADCANAAVGNTRMVAIVSNHFFIGSRFIVV